MGLGGAYKLGGDFKIIIGQATKRWGHFLWGHLTPQDTKVKILIWQMEEG